MEKLIYLDNAATTLRKPIRSSRSRWPEIIIRKFNRTYTI